MRRKKIIIVGAGTFASNMVFYLEDDKNEDWEIIGMVDNYFTDKERNVLGYKVIGSDDLLPDLFKKGVEYAALGIGATADFNMNVRKQVSARLKTIGFKIPNIVSNLSVVHKSVIMGEGVVIPPYVVIDPEVKIGDSVFLSPYVYLSHHVQLGNYIFVSSFTNFVGGTVVKDESFIGMSATIGRNVGGNCNIYPKTLVMEEVNDNMIAFGNPMRVFPKSFNKKI